TVDDHLPRPNELSRRDVIFLHPDRAMSLVPRRLGRRTVVHDVGAAAVVEEDRRIDSVEVAKPDGLGPGASGIRRCEDEVAAAIRAGCDEIERAFVIANRWRVNALRDPAAVEVELCRPIEHVT